MSIFEASLLFLLVAGLGKICGKTFREKPCMFFRSALQVFQWSCSCGIGLLHMGFPSLLRLFSRCAAGENGGLALFFKKMYPKVVESSKRRVHLASLGRLVLA